MSHPIELHRKKIGMTRAAVAAVIGISYSLITEIERGNRWREGVPHEHVKQLADLFGVPKEVVVFWQHAKNKRLAA